MATQVQWRRGTHAQVLAFTGAAGEIVVDQTQNRLVVQDGMTTGGWPLALQNNDTLTGQTLVTATLSSGSIGSGVLAVTQTVGDNSTKIATTAFVQISANTPTTGSSLYIAYNYGGF